MVNCGLAMETGNDKRSSELLRRGKSKGCGRFCCLALHVWWLYVVVFVAAAAMVVWSHCVGRPTPTVVHHIPQTNSASNKPSRCCRR